MPRRPRPRFAWPAGRIVPARFQEAATTPTPVLSDSPPPDGAPAEPTLAPAAPLDPTLGRTPANPVAFGEPIEAGPLRVNVREILTGQAATDAVLAASPLNAAPRDGVGFVLARLSVENGGTVPLGVSNDDFALVGADGAVRRFLGADPPAPALEADLAPGDAVEGWIALSARADEGAPLLLVDPLALSGSWASRYAALVPGAVVVAEAPASEPDAAGTDPAAPVAVGGAATTVAWRVELLQVVRGAAVFDLVDYRTGALKVDDATGASDGSEWVALQVRATNLDPGPARATFPANAFQLADVAGAPILDMATLTPPRPDIAGDYEPGASREGWVCFDVPVEFEPVLVRFQPYPHTNPDQDPRFFFPA
jgi:hypothetical protein